MIGFHFINSSVRLLHSRDLEDMRDAVLLEGEQVRTPVSETANRDKEPKVVALRDLSEAS